MAFATMALIAAAHRLHQVKHAIDFGVAGVNPEAIAFDPTALPHTKRSAAGTGYRQHYGEAEARLVGQLCAKEIEAFGYRF